MKNHTYFPIFISLTGKRAVVYGGGTIAARRVSALLRYGAEVLLFAPGVGQAVKELQKLYPDTLRVSERPFEPGIPEADFVFSAVDDSRVDACIHKECRERGIPVNIASDKSLCDFYFPALVEHGDVVIGLSSGGRDHKKVRLTAQRLREFLGGAE